VTGLGFGLVGAVGLLGVVAGGVVLSAPVGRASAGIGIGASEADVAPVDWSVVAGWSPGAGVVPSDAAGGGVFVLVPEASGRAGG
jgi:hypothetical protein